MAANYSFKASSTLFLVGLLLTVLFLKASEALANRASEKEQTLAIFGGDDGIPLVKLAHGRKLLQLGFSLSQESETKVANFMNDTFGKGGSKVGAFFSDTGKAIANVATSAWNGVKKAARALWPF